jgi:hypothetical protein
MKRKRAPVETDPLRNSRLRLIRADESREWAPSLPSREDARHHPAQNLTTVREELVSVVRIHPSPHLPPRDRDVSGLVTAVTSALTRMCDAQVVNLVRKGEQESPLRAGRYELAVGRPRLSFVFTGIIS